MYWRNHTSYETLKLKFCTCVQSNALCTCAKFQIEILIIIVISGIVYFHKIIFGSSRYISETLPGSQMLLVNYIMMLLDDMVSWVKLIRRAQITGHVAMRSLPIIYEAWYFSLQIQATHNWSIRVWQCNPLTHWGRVMHICIGKLTINGPDNGLSPGRRQAIIWTNAGILLIWPLGTNFSEILIEINTFSFTKNAFENVVCEMPSILSRPQCVKLSAN